MRVGGLDVGGTAQNAGGHTRGCSKFRLKAHGAVHRALKSLGQSLRCYGATIDHYNNNNHSTYKEDDGVLGMSDVKGYMERVGLLDSGDCETAGQVLDPRIVDIKCIILLINQEKPIIVILDREDTISMVRLSRYLQVPKRNLKLAPPGRVREISGYNAGSVPPLGHPTPLTTVVDRKVYDGSHMRFGPEGQEVVVDPKSFVKATDRLYSSVGVADIVGPRKVDRGTYGDGVASELLPVPWDKGSDRVCFTVKVARRRKLAKTLVCATVTPAGGSFGSAFQIPGRGVKKTRVWRSPESGEICEIQLILGKTLERKYGREKMIDILRRVKSGGHVCVQGRPQTHANHDVVDVVVSDIEFLSSSAVKQRCMQTAPPIVMPCAESQSFGDGSAAGSADMNDESNENVNNKSSSNDGSIAPYLNLKKYKKKRAITGELPVYKHQVDSIRMVRSLEDIEGMKNFFESAVGKHQEDMCSHLDGTEGIVKEHKWIAQVAKNCYGKENWQPAVCVGIDAEWRPVAAPRKSPVSLLQIGTAKFVYLIDMLEICHHSHMENGLTAEEALLSDFFEFFFGNPYIVKLGFGLRYDLKRVRESYDFMPCFHVDEGEQRMSSPYKPILSHVDILQLARESTFGDPNTSFKRMGLNKLAMKVLEQELDKNEQLSDWGQRPLDQNQVDYAVADVACVAEIFEKIVANKPDILTPRVMVHVALNLFDLTTFGSSVARKDNVVEYFSEEELKHPKKVLFTPIKEVECGVDALGEYIGRAVSSSKLEVLKQACYGKEKNVGTRPSFKIPRGAPLLETNNCFLIFINVPSAYPNTFEVIRDEATCTMVWWSSRGQTLQHPVIQRLLNGEKDILLFCRPQKQPYRYFGKLYAPNENTEELENCVKVTWVLQDFQVLSACPSFQEILNLQS
eukprot:jgi/Picsp_1/6110/NSC_03464-R1_probable exonuclease mut-7 homolog